MNRRIVRPLQVAALVLALALVPAALAGKGKGNGGNSGSTGSYSVTVSPGGPYSFGEWINITTDAPIYPDNAGPWITIACYQNRTLVGVWSHAAFPGGSLYGSPYLLGPTQTWTGGAADCTVAVFHQSDNKDVTDATTSFNVSG